jgi:hypothetical protein
MAETRRNEERLQSGTPFHCRVPKVGNLRIEFECKMAQIEATVKTAKRNGFD